MFTNTQMVRLSGLVILALILTNRGSAQGTDGSITFAEPCNNGTIATFDLVGTGPFEVYGSDGTYMVTFWMGGVLSHTNFPCQLPYVVYDGNGAELLNIQHGNPKFKELSYLWTPDGSGSAYDCNTGLATYGFQLSSRQVSYANPINSYPSIFESEYSYTLTGPVVRSGLVSSLPTSGLNKLLVDLPPGTYQITLTSPHTAVYLDNTCPGITYERYDCEQTLTRSITIPPMPYSIGDCASKVTGKFFLQAAMPVSGSLMDDDLRINGLIPLSEPYTALGYSFSDPGVTGTTIPLALLNVTGNNAIVDWVIMELRSSNAPSLVLHSRPALVQRDGDVVDTDGDQYIHFPNAPFGSYFIGFRHRNHLGLVTRLPWEMGALPLAMYNWDHIWMGSPQPATILVNGEACAWAGNVNFDDRISYTGAGNDRDPILQRIGGVVPTNTVSGYYSEDVNMDGIVRYTGTANDRDIILSNIGGVTPTAVRVDYVP